MARKNSNNNFYNARPITNTCVIKIKFDNIEKIKSGTYKKINSLTRFKSDYGYCKITSRDFNFRLLEENSLKPFKNHTNLKKVSTTLTSICLYSDSDENLEKLINEISERIMEIDNFKLEITYM